MESKFKKRKYVYLGDTNSINIEIICKAFPSLKNKVEYLLIGNIFDLKSYLKRINSKLKINEIYNPINFDGYKNSYLNIFSIDNISKEKHKNLINQIKISNNIANETEYDLITMPIDKTVFKKKIKFVGLTEFLGELNNCKTLMLMHGERFSIIPYTTHISLKKVHQKLKSKSFNNFIKETLTLIKKKKYNLNFKQIKFLCYNPHCGEGGTLGNEDKLISNIISKYKKVTGPFSGDSAFNNIENNCLYLSTYHDQALIPFKIINKKGVNFTLGLNYRRLSPAHGTAVDKKYKNIADTVSYVACMQI